MVGDEEADECQDDEEGEDMDEAVDGGEHGERADEGKMVCGHEYKHNAPVGEEE